MYRIERTVGNSHVGADGTLTLGAAVDFMQDCCGFQLDHEKQLTEYFHENQITIFLISRQVNFHRPITYGEQVRIETSNGELRISSYAGGAFIDLKQMKATTIPKEIIATVPIDEKFSGMEYLPRKIRLPRDIVPEVMPAVKVCKAHIDINQHMNNSQYYRIAEEYLPEDFVIHTARCEYKEPASRGMLMIPQVSHLEKDGCENSVYVISLQEESGGVFANVEFR